MGRGQFGPQDLDWQDRDHEALLHTKYVSCGPHGFREDFFKFFSIIFFPHFKCMEAIDP